MSLSHPRIADAVVVAGSRGNLDLTLHGRPYSCSAAGQIIGDDLHSLGESPDAVTRWRFSRMRAAGLYSSIGIAAESHANVEPARPSDAVLLGLTESIYRDGQEYRTSPWTASAAALYDVERIVGSRLETVIARAQSLGLGVPPHAASLPPSTPAVRTALSFSGRQNADGSLRPISVFDVLQTSWALDIPSQTVVTELRQRHIDYSYRADSLESLPLPPELLIAASQNADGIAPWLSSTDEVGLRNVAVAARATAAQPGFIVAGLRELGFADVPHLSPEHAVITEDDLLMLTVDLDGLAPYLGPFRPASRQQVKRAAERLRLTEEQVQARLAEYGVAVTGKKWRDPERAPTKKETLRILGFRTGSQRATISRSQLRLMSRDGDALPPWLDPLKPIPAWLVATKALHGLSIDTIMDAYRELGYIVEDPRTAPVTPRPGPASAADAPGG
ncbi:wHTH domain-containing protein [Subtercola boreus]|uniref:wHTH-Hsp90 Na associated domain-containing protein n=2 Tax=Subtercola boreus TaxID=120213 RepID=A0A3E0WEX4_9MICO|nr:hypothetical protein [Subtercola boreus]RFA22121.1 hypothetical protein B7R24_05440 [Subtercola boreus]RFA22301.1 hypothetical protein B7R23_05385 [Subtercola boreus]RFA28165.1 hypothetical protein B7R25_05510 [Subtercola boreus]